MDELFMRQHTTENRILDRLQQIKSQPLEQSLDRLKNQLQDLYTGSKFPLPYARVVSEICEGLDDPQKLTALILNWEKATDETRIKIESTNNKKTKSLHRKSLEKLNFEESIKFATLYIELSSKLKDEGKTEQACAYCIEAAYLCGEISATSLIQLDTLTIEKTRKQNSKNAQSINKKTNLLKEYIAQLIEAHAPKDGWPTKTEAISAIASIATPNKASNDYTNSRTLIESFIIENDIRRVQASNIENRILKSWANEPGAIQKALKKTVQPRRVSNRRSLHP